MSKLLLYIRALFWYMTHFHASIWFVLCDSICTVVGFSGLTNVLRVRIQGLLRHTKNDCTPDNTSTFMSVKIAGVLVSSYKSCECLVRHSEMVPVPEVACLSKCTKCAMGQITDSCSTQTSATLHVFMADQHFSLTAFTSILKSIILPN